MPKNSGPRAGWKFMKEPEFEKIKALVNLGLTTPEIGRVIGRGNATITKVRNSKTWEDYRSMREREAAQARVRAAKKNGSPVRTMASVPKDFGIKPIQFKHKSDLTKVESRHDPLERIATALERLADAWEKQPEKKNGFFK